MKNETERPRTFGKCESCDGKQFSLFFSTKRFQLWECVNCGLIRTDKNGETGWPVKEIYDDKLEAEKQFKLQRRKFERYATEILDFLTDALPKTKGHIAINKNHKRLLDIGCGLGWVVAEAKKRGFDAMGIDPAKVYVEVGRKQLKVNLFAGTLKAFSERPPLKGLAFLSFDVVILKHVLEHIEDLDSFFVEAKKMLAPGGLLLVAVPNIQSLMFLIFKERWYGLQPEQHVWQFTPQSLLWLLEKNGFRIIKTRITNLDYEAKGIKGVIIKLILTLAIWLKQGDQLFVLARAL